MLLIGSAAKAGLAARHATASGNSLVLIFIILILFGIDFVWSRYRGTYFLRDHKVKTKVTTTAVVFRLLVYVVAFCTVGFGAKVAVFMWICWFYIFGFFSQLFGVMTFDAFGHSDRFALFGVTMAAGTFKSFSCVSLVE
jgi:hypothetical protein